ncbi:MAG: tetratricopeptide repeat protein, partial [Omnitrophica WOR_2 bacterium]
MESPITFGEWLRQSRNELRCTREDFARRVGCSVSTLRKIEDGERRPSKQIAELIANCLNIPAAERSIFVKVARGELSPDRLPPISKILAGLRDSPVPPAPRIHLPVLPTPLIGRQREVEELSRLLLDPQCRLLTLVGPGGIGKTRLAIETAEHVQDAFSDGIYFVPLVSVNTTRFLMPVIADAVGFTIQSSSRSDPKIQLFNYLKEKQALLLIDNLEHLLVEPGIELLSELLASAPQVKLLATSRESLGLQAEWVFEVQGLPVPESQYTQESMPNTSVELFLQRARRAYVDFSPMPEEYPAIVRICQLVGGMPLAIELAAAWVRTLACNEIAQEIERGLDFLSVSARDLPTRHRSMRAVFDHSWKLLNQEEQEILNRLSVFRGGFRREAAETVVGAKLSVLSSLVLKSLVRRSVAGRYDLHELIQQFAANQIAERPDEQTATQARHGRYYLTFFAQADGRLRSSAQREALVELTSEMDNFRAAWDWAVSHGEFALIEQTLRMFWLLYDTRGWFQDGLDTLGRAIDALESAHEHSQPDRQDQVALGHLLTVRSWLTYRLGQYEQSQTMLERSLEILRPLNETRVLVESIHIFGQVMEVTGNYARALDLYSEGLEMAKAINDRWYSALCHTNLYGLIANTDVITRPEDTHEQLQSAVTNWRIIGDPRLTAFGLRILSQSAFISGHYDESRLALEESAALNSTVGDRWGLGSAYRGLGLISQAQGKHPQAITMFRKSLDTFTELGGSWWVARVLAEMSQSLFALGNEAEAGRVCRESLRIETEIQGTPEALDALAC